MSLCTTCLCAQHHSGIRYTDACGAQRHAVLSGMQCTAACMLCTDTARTYQVLCHAPLPCTLDMPMCRYHLALPSCALLTCLQHTSPHPPAHTCGPGSPGGCFSTCLMQGMAFSRKISNLWSSARYPPFMPTPQAPHLMPRTPHAPHVPQALSCHVPSTHPMEHGPKSPCGHQGRVFSPGPS